MQKDSITAAEYQALLKGEKKHKYGAKPKTTDGIYFQSTGEADRYTTLKMLENAKEITGLQRQVPFKLTGCVYKLDFMYFDYRTKQMVFEDFKGCKTAEYRLKKKMMKELWGIEITESKK